MHRLFCVDHTASRFNSSNKQPDSLSRGKSKGMGRVKEHRSRADVCVAEHGREWSCRVRVALAQTSTSALVRSDKLD